MTRPSSDDCRDPAAGYRFAQLRRDLPRADGLRYRGELAGGGTAIVDLYGELPADLPDVLDAASLLRANAGDAPPAGTHWLLGAGRSEWRLDEPGVRVFVHRPAAEALRGAIVPRAAPLARRLVWRGLLGLLATRAGRRLLGAVRGGASG